MLKLFKTFTIFITVLFLFLVNACSETGKKSEVNQKKPTYQVNKSTDFDITGSGNNENWQKADWIELTKRKQFADNQLKTSAKMLYSETGLYFLFNCEDNELTATLNDDFQDLWNEDVVEVFLQSDENNPVYFEYELSPLNYELAIMVANVKDELLRWQPFHYESNRQTQHATTVTGGEKKSGAVIDGWIAEFFIPYTLLKPLNNVPPQKGDIWRANFYREDYDRSQNISWLWSHTETNFHDYKNFGSIVFK